MDVIQKCAAHFLKLINTTSYIFHVANKKVYCISVNFEQKDFYHLAGLHYLSDISIPKDKRKTISWILNSQNPITDGYLARSEFYKGSASSERHVENRIKELGKLEEYLDTNNIIRIFRTTDKSNSGSIINCNYVIESKLEGSSTVVYIFLKHRGGEDSPCCVVSFAVKKNNSYGGQKLYWMLKDKVVNGKRITLFQHPNYLDGQKEKTEKVKG